MGIGRESFDDLVTLVTQAPPWEKDRLQGVRVLLRGIGEGKVDAPGQILARWTWKLARSTRKVQDRRAGAEFPEAKRLLGALANSRGHRHEENAAKLVAAALEEPLHVGVALLASAEGYTPRANALLETARERIADLPEVANALADNLPAPKLPSAKRRRKRRRRRGRAGGDAGRRVQGQGEEQAPPEQQEQARPQEQAQLTESEKAEPAELPQAAEA
jgi:hypothetical protein